MADNLKRVLFPSPNGAILVECKILHYIASSAAGTEIARVFYNTQVVILIKYILEQLGRPQLPILIKTNNSTAVGFIHNNIYQNQSKL